MTDQGLVRETACAVVDRLNAGEVTPLDLLDVLERRIAEIDDKVNALPTLCFDRARSHAKALMKKPAGAARPARGPAGADQGSDQRGRRPHHPGFADLPGQRAGAVGHSGRTPRREWRRHLRQIEHARIRRGRQYVQRSVRRDAQSMGHVAICCRLVRRRRGGAGHRHGVACARLGHGRLAAQPRQLLRHRGNAAQHRARSAHPGCRNRPNAGRARSDGAQCRGSRTVAGRDERRASGGSALVAGTARLRSSPPPAPARNRSASPIRAISASRRSIRRSRPSPARPPNGSRKQARSSRRPIPTCVKPMNASTCCAPSISRSARRRCCGASATCSSPK